jgi:hypothetical protein
VQFRCSWLLRNLGRLNFDMGNLLHMALGALKYVHKCLDDSSLLQCELSSVTCLQRTQHKR